MIPVTRSRLASVALVSAVQLGFEMLVIKLGRYELGSLAIGTIGLAILGVSLAGAMTKRLGGAERAPVRALAILLPISLLVGAYFFSRPHEFHDQAHTYVAMLACGGASLVLLALSSVPVFAALTLHAEDVSRVYAASLAGATVGAPLVLAAMEISGDVGAFALIVLLAGASGAAFAIGPRIRALFGAGALLAALACVIWFPRLDRAAHPGVRLIETDATSRIDVYERAGGRLQIRTAGVNAGTTTAGGTVHMPPDSLLHELSATAFRLRPRTALLLGTGAGKNVVQALASGTEQLVAVEINPMIPRALDRMLAPSANTYRDPRVTLVVGEGRETAAVFAARGDRFDLVYVPIATLFGSSGHTFTETYLMTREAFVQYAASLAPRGCLAVFFPDVVRAKVVRAMAEALVDLGVDEVASHLVVVNRGGGFIVLSRVDAPFAADERARIVGADGPEVDVATELERARGMRALSDDNPFLYNDLWSARGMRALYGWNLRFLRQAYLGSLVVLVVALVVASKHSSDVPFAPRVGTLAAFVLMGIAYTAQQTLVLQRLAFLVGHPVIATAIVLPMTLLGSALGARLSGMVPASRHGAFRLAGFVVLVAASLPLVAVAPEVYVAPQIPTLARHALAALLAFVLFVPLGTYFPIAFTRVERDTPALAAPAWLVNGLGAVVGSFVAIYGPMLFGFRSAALLALGAYALLSLWDARVVGGSPSSRAHAGLAVGATLLLSAFTLVLETARVGGSP